MSSFRFWRCLLLSFCVVTFCVSVVSAQHKSITPTTSFTVSGHVRNPGRFSLKGLQDYPKQIEDSVMVIDKKGMVKTTLYHVQGVLLTDVLNAADIQMADNRDYNRLAVILTASDGYTNVYSWNELYNTPVGKAVYIVTSVNDSAPGDYNGAILVFSNRDLVSGRRHMKALQNVEVRLLTPAE